MNAVNVGYGSGYAHFWKLIQVKRIALDMGIRWVDEGRTINAVILENGWSVLLSDIVTTLHRQLGLNHSSFLNIKTRYSRALRVEARMTGLDQVPNSGQDQWEVLRWLVSEEMAMPNSMVRAEREASQLLLADIQRLVMGLEAICY